MRIIPSHGYRRMPWKNGGGETTEVFASPAGSALDAFDWRVSMARVAIDGPFSLFPDIDRTLIVLTGEGVMLDIAERGSTKLDRHSTPYAFPGDIAISSRLLKGPIDDLNVMTRRGRYRHHVARLNIDGSINLAARGEVLLAMIRDASASATDGATRLLLGDGDTLMLDRRESASLTPDGAATLFLIDLWRL